MQTGEARAVIWDVDGTMLDSAELHYQAWDRIARELGKPFTRADFAATFGWRNAEIVPNVFGSEYSEAQVREIGDRKEELYREEARKGMDLLPGVRALLEGLRQAGFKQAVGSSAPRANLDLLLKATGTVQFFNAMIGAEDTTRGKPDPQVFLRAAERLGVPPDRCVVIEDAPVGVKAAKAGGMRCIGVTFAGHHPESALHEAGADLVVRSIDEVSVATLDRLL